MRCLKCGFITFDYLKDCPKCKAPADAIVKELFPLQFKPNPPDFTKDYLDVIHGFSFDAGPGTQAPPPAQEVELEEIAVEDVELGEDLLKHFQTQEVTPAEITLKLEDQGEKQPEMEKEPELKLAFEPEQGSLKEKPPEIELELENLVLEEEKPELPKTIPSLSLQEEVPKASGPETLEEPILVLEEEPESAAKEEELEVDSKFLKIKDLPSLEGEEMKEIQIGLKLEELDEDGRKKEELS
jgi:hypothetical protein